MTDLLTVVVTVTEDSVTVTVGASALRLARLRLSTSAALRALMPASLPPGLAGSRARSLLPGTLTPSGSCTTYGWIRQVGSGCWGRGGTVQVAVFVTVVIMEDTVQVLSVRVKVVVSVVLVTLGVTVTIAVADGRVTVAVGVTVMFLSTYCVVV